jgi:hypothetical protein
MTMLAITTMLIMMTIMTKNNNYKPSELEDSLHKSPTIMVGETNIRKLGENRVILKPSWALVRTKKITIL